MSQLAERQPQQKQFDTEQMYGDRKRIERRATVLGWGKEPFSAAMPVKSGRNTTHQLK